MVGHLDPASNTFQEWQIPTRNANPYSLAVTTVSGKVMVWGTEFGTDKVFAFFPDSGTFFEYTLPHSTTGVGYISIEPASAQVRVWFTETLRNANGEFVYDPKSGNVTLYEDKFPAAVGGGAYGVTAGSNSVWFAGFTSLVKWDRSSQQYSIWPLPVHGTALGRFIMLDLSGQAWYTQGETNGTSTDNFVGVLSGDLIQEWRLASPGADPRGISVNPLTQQPWVAERSPSAGNAAIAVLANSTGETFVTSLHSTAPSGGTPYIIGPVSHVANATNSTISPTSRQITSLSDPEFGQYGLGSNQPHDIIVDSAGNAWISEPGANKIGRLSGFIPDFALNASPSLLSLSLGQSGTVSVKATSASGYQGSVALSGNAPVGVKVSFTPGQINVPSGGTASSKITIDVATNAQVGNSSIILQGDGTIAHSTSLLLIVTNSTALGTQKPQCLIATATYGSQLSPEVELLRSFRDGAVKSRIGWSFLIMFNTWYYSFSPMVANYINEHSTARPAMQVILYPLIGFLRLAFQVNIALTAFPEAATLLSGLLASALIGGFYLGLPLGVLSRRIRLFKRMSAKPWGVTLLGGIVSIVVGELLVLPALLMLSTSVVVLSTMLVAAMLTKAAISK
jgi:streptogramin lyase